MTQNLPAANEQFREFRAVLENQMAGQIRAVLPKPMALERFARVCLTAVSSNPRLLQADRASLWNACLRCAQDGLLPDSREAVFVTYEVKDKKNGGRRYVVTYIPMIFGIIKKVRQSGEIATITARVRYAKDHFYRSEGDDERIEHVPADGDRGPAVGAYAIATLRDGHKEREYMPLSEIEKVRACSRASDGGPWKDWWDQMACKTVIRRLSKRLPMPDELHELMRRDDDLYDLERLNKPAGEPIAAASQEPQAPKLTDQSNSMNRLDRFAARQGPAQQPAGRSDQELEPLMGFVPEPPDEVREQQLRDGPGEGVTQTSAPAPQGSSKVVSLASQQPLRPQQASAARASAVAASARTRQRQPEIDWPTALHELNVALECCIGIAAVDAVAERFEERLARAPEEVRHEAHQRIEGRRYEIEQRQTQPA
jgi:recombination protein RecT